jgi:wobble nucleotide-excising tRNase
MARKPTVLDKVLDYIEIDFRLTQTEKIALIVLARTTGEHFMCPSIDYLSKKLHISSRGVQFALQKLVINKAILEWVLLGLLDKEWVFIT